MSKIANILNDKRESVLLTKAHSAALTNASLCLQFEREEKVKVENGKRNL